jgi:hypothetical protein
LRNSSPDWRTVGLNSSTGKRGRKSAACKASAAVTVLLPACREHSNSTRGSATIAVGLTGTTAVKNGSAADSYATAGDCAAAGNTLQRFTDTAAFDAALTGSFTLLAAAPPGRRSVAWPRCPTRADRCWAGPPALPSPAWRFGDRVDPSETGFRS